MNYIIGGTLYLIGFMACLFLLAMTVGASEFEEIKKGRVLTARRMIALVFKSVLWPVYLPLALGLVVGMASKEMQEKDGES